MTIKACSILLIDEENKVLLQHRDDKPNIWNPGAWGLFGGSLEQGESFEEAIIRETKEELNYNLKDPKLFDKLISEEKVIYSFYKKIKNEEKKTLKLLEGQDWGWFTFDKADKLNWKDGREEWDRNASVLKKLLLRNK